MRQVQELQVQLGETPIEAIEFDPMSRDDIPQILRGLQYIYITDDLRESVFKILEDNLIDNTASQTGRPGMNLWKILVMGALRVNLNWDYDRLHEQVNEHRTIRQMLGHADGWDDPYKYHLQTLKDNVSLLTPELLDEISGVIVKAGHKLFKKEGGDINGRCDSFVVETDVHFPTDINLMWDAMRVLITLLGQLCFRFNLSDWRQWQYNIREFKKLFRLAQKSKKFKSENKKKEAHQQYLDQATIFITKAKETAEKLTKLGAPQSMIEKMLEYIKHCERQWSQIHRRVILKEIIPNKEKVYSIFEPHTEWVSKGKAGKPVELGVKVCVMECQNGFILHHRVMQQEQDVDVAVRMVEQTQEIFSNLNQCSFDKGFHSPDNQKELSKILDLVVLPRKGRLSADAKEAQNAPEFIEARKKHSAVESAINALEVHGLDRCPDRGIEGFKRYVSLAVLSRNIQKIGAYLDKKEKESIRKDRLRRAA